MTNALFADIENRTLRGLLLPYNELSSPSVSETAPVMFAKGTVEIPADVSALNANRLHSQFAPVARFTKVEETEAGIVAHFAVAKTEDGDNLLLEAADDDVTKRPRLSAEIRGLVRDGANAVKAALTGAAFVPQGAFASAALFSIADELDDGLEERIKAVVKAAMAEHSPNTNDTPSEDSPIQQEEEAMTASAAAAVPDGLTAPAEPTSTSVNTLFSALIAPRDSVDTLQKIGRETGDLFAISPVQHSGPSTVTIGADVQVPQVLGELWKRRAYQRKFTPLFNQSALTSMKARGWRFVEGKEPVVGDYTGNTAEIPSNAIDTEEVTVDALRIAGGHKLDRRFADFGDTSIIASYFDHMTDDYSRKTDAKALAAALAGATTMTSTVAGTGIATGLSAIVDGALAVIASENTPSFAIVSPELWRDIVLTPNESVLGYLSASLGLEEGSTAGFRVIPGNVGTGKVLVGAKEAMTTFELPGVPIRVEGIDPHHGAIDPALFGYYANLVNATKALQLVTAYTAGE
ncbi:Major capsid protein [Salinibacterium sp. NYA9b]